MGKLYDTDMSDAAWALVAPLLPPAKPGGRPRTTRLRAVLNAVFYLLRSGCQWRLLPREYPPWSTAGTAARLGVRGRKGYFQARFPVEVEATWSGS